MKDTNTLTVRELRTRKLEKRRQGVRESQDRRRLRNREWVYQYLLRNPCVDCGEEDPVVLEFDHIEDKSTPVATAVTNYTTENLIAEVAKCEVRCGNCHKKVTAVERGTYRAHRQYGLT